jgi:hypothetical protein
MLVITALLLVISLVSMLCDPGAVSFFNLSIASSNSSTLGVFLLACPDVLPCWFLLDFLPHQSIPSLQAALGNIGSIVPEFPFYY